MLQLTISALLFHKKQNKKHFYHYSHPVSYGDLENILGKNPSYVNDHIHHFFFFNEIIFINKVYLFFHFNPHIMILANLIAENIDFRGM